MREYVGRDGADEGSADKDPVLGGRLERGAETSSSSSSSSNGRAATERAATTHAAAVDRILVVRPVFVRLAVRAERRVDCLADAERLWKSRPEVVNDNVANLEAGVLQRERGPVRRAR